MARPASPVETDALIVGAGPAGLFQVFELGLLEINAHIVDALPHPGGQCVELYGDKPIYDIPGLAVCTGRELVDRLLRQIEPFAATFHLGQQVTELRQQEDGRFFVATSQGTRFNAKTVFVAAGVGAFLPRALNVPGIDRFAGSQLFYSTRQAGELAGQRVVIVGGEDGAVQAALQACAAGADATLLHRRDSLRGPAESLERIQSLRDSGQLKFVAGQVTGFDEANGRVTALRVVDSGATTHSLRADKMIVQLGISPKLGPVADWGLDLERKQLKVDTEKFSTSVPGIFAVGDINTYPGKKKLILCAFHECTLAAFGAAAIVFPGAKILLQYTTTSSRLHELLGVQPQISE